MHKRNRIYATRVIAFAVALVTIICGFGGCGEIPNNTSGITSNDSSRVSSIINSSQVESKEDDTSNIETNSDFIDPTNFASEVTLCEVDENIKKYVPKIYDTIEMLNKCKTMTEVLSYSHVVDPGHVCLSYEVLVKAMQMQEISEDKQKKYFDKWGPCVYVSKKVFDQLIEDYFCDITENITFDNLGRVFVDEKDELYRHAITSYGGNAGVAFMHSVKQVEGKIVVDFVHAFKKDMDIFLYSYDPWSTIGEKRIAYITADGKITPNHDELNTAKKVRYTFCIEDGDIKLYSIKSVEN